MGRWQVAVNEVSGNIRSTAASGEEICDNPAAASYEKHGYSAAITNKVSSQSATVAIASSARI